MAAWILLQVTVLRETLDFGAVWLGVPRSNFDGSNILLVLKNNVVIYSDAALPYSTLCCANKSDTSSNMFKQGSGRK